MATRAIVPVEEYLHSSYEPECEYLDGKVVECNVGTAKHTRLHAEVGAYFYTRRKPWGIDVLSVQRVRIRERRYRVPDLCITLGREESEDILTSAPLIWIEILPPKIVQFASSRRSAKCSISVVSAFG